MAKFYYIWLVVAVRNWRMLCQGVAAFICWILFLRFVFEVYLHFYCIENFALGFVVFGLSSKVWLTGLHEATLSTDSWSMYFILIACKIEMVAKFLWQNRIAFSYNASVVNAVKLPQTNLTSLQEILPKNILVSFFLDTL